jgi:hypothetical protein
VLSASAFEREVNFDRRFAERVPIKYTGGVRRRTRRLRQMRAVDAGLEWMAYARPARARRSLKPRRPSNSPPAVFWDSPLLRAESSWLPDWDADYMRAAASDYRACLPEFLRRFRARLPATGVDAAQAIGERFDVLADRLTEGVQVLTHYDYRVETCSVIGVVGGANADLSNPRNEELFAAIGQRGFNAVVEGNCLAELP